MHLRRGISSLILFYFIFFSLKYSGKELESEKQFSTLSQ